jgi:hypothetical protein
VLMNIGNDEVIKQVRTEVNALMSSRPLFQW